MPNVHHRMPKVHHRMPKAKVYRGQELKGGGAEVN